MTPFGIGNFIWKTILSTCFQFSAVNQVILYGSRARGDYRNGSDIDIAIDAPEMTDHEFSILWNTLDDLPIIYTLDVVHLQSISNIAFIQAIERDGIKFTRVA
jgi:predicted nucleotidyltransferase